MKKLIFYILIIIAFIPAISSAQYTLLEPLPCIPDTQNNCSSGELTTELELNTYIEYIFKFAIAFAVFAAIIVIIWGGFQIMLSETPFKIGAGKEKITNALIGLAMVLASYLILATIDPRLVEINTGIEPIDSSRNRSGLLSLQQQLSEDLSLLSDRIRDDVANMEGQKKILQSEINKLVIRRQNNEITDDEYVKAAAKLNSELEKLNVEQETKIASGLGLVDFNRAYKELYSTTGVNNQELLPLLADPVENVLVNGKLPTDSKNEIQNKYNKRINKIKESDPERANLLGLQRDFYIVQIKEEWDLRNLTEAHGTIPTTGGMGRAQAINHTDELEARLEQYEANLKDEHASIGVGLGREEYDKIMQTRVALIKKALEKPIPK